MNTRSIKHFGAFVFLVGLVCIRLGTLQADGKAYTVSFPARHLDVAVEVAVTQVERERGLMHRATLGEKQGMLFVFPDIESISIWMKNTLLPLDVLFLDADGRVVDLLENVPPCTNDPCPVYAAKQPSKYMLELNARFVRSHGISTGELLLLPSLAR